MAFLMRKTEKIIHEIEGFLTVVSESGIVFEKGVQAYLEQNRAEHEKWLEKAIRLENQADEIRRNVEKTIYINTLIPEYRGDVLAILENTDDVIDCVKETLQEFSVEQPMIPVTYHRDFQKLSLACRNAVENLVMGIRAFFHDIQAVNNYAHKVHFYETEADDIGDRMRRSIFASDLELSHKLHLRMIIKDVEAISDFAEDVIDRLVIYAIKRQM